MARLSGSDVTALKAMRAFVVDADRSTPLANSAFLAELASAEAKLPSMAKAAWFGWSHDRLVAEIAKWRPAFRLVRTRTGTAAYRWIGRRKSYAKRATVTGLRSDQLGPFSGMVRC